MNVLKALAKMTKLAAALEHQLGITRRDFAEEKNKRLLTDQVAAERYDLVKSLEAKLYAAEEKAKIVPPPIYTLAEKLAKSLGYSFDHTHGWTRPPPLAPMPDLAPADSIEPTTIACPAGDGWRSHYKPQPRDMTQRVDAVLFNGNSLTVRADKLDWNESSVGVAWWRFTQAQDV